MTPRRKRRAVPRYKRRPTPPKIRRADPAVVAAFRELQEAWYVQQEPHINAPTSSPLELHREERLAWRRLMNALLQTPVPRGS